MDRKRKTSSSAHIDRSTHLRRRQNVCRRIVNQKEAVYALLTVSILTISLIIILVLDSISDPGNIYPPLSTSAEVHTFASWSHKQYAAAGSTKTLEALLQNITTPNNHTENGKLVVAFAVNYAYRKLALNFLCNLRRLGVQNYIILAMDNAVFSYLKARNANVFFYRLERPHSRKLLSLNNIETGALFGSSAFVETSRRKSILVLKVLKLGYSVIFSDVDVVWVRNPIPVLLKHSSDFVVQSDRSHISRDAPLNYNINSGFYFARSSAKTITALQAIVKYSSAIRRSEQKAFNYVLCGAFKDSRAGPGIRIGSSECAYAKIGVRAKVLPLESFPNGSDQRLWSSSSNFISEHPSVVVVHANYDNGRAEKVEKIRRIGFWLYVDHGPERDGCIITSRSRPVAAQG